MMKIQQIQKNNNIQIYDVIGVERCKTMILPLAFQNRYIEFKIVSIFSFIDLFSVELSLDIPNVFSN